MKESTLKMVLDGSLYNSINDEILEEQQKRFEILYDFNQLRPGESQKREELMKKMFAKLGKNCYFQAPFHSNWAGAHVYLGDNVYGNFNLTLVDDANIYIGDNTLFGPNVTVVTAAHPIEPELRSKGYEFNIEVKIGKNVWVGANSVILPGVEIGDNTVIGAGSVVTKSLPSNVVAFGTPCRVIREIGERDRLYYYKDRKIEL